MFFSKEEAQKSIVLALSRWKDWTRPRRRVRRGRVRRTALKNHWTLWRVWTNAGAAGVWTRTKPSTCEGP